MPFHMGGFGEDIDLAGATGNLAALADPVLFVSGDTLRVPALDKVFGLFGGLGSGGTQVMSLVAPSLREIGNFVVSPTNGGADADVEPGDPPVGADLRDTSIQLVRGENVTCEAQSNTSAAAFQWLLAVFGDQVKPVPQGRIRTLRFTMTNTLTARVWSNSAIVAAEELARGEYAVVGMHAVGASVIAARLVPIGGEGWRPGCMGADTHASQPHPMFRFGGLGEWFRFQHEDIPSVDVLTDLGDSDVDVYLDLIKVG